MIGPPLVRYFFHSAPMEQPHGMSPLTNPTEIPHGRRLPNEADPNDRPHLTLANPTKL